MAKSKMIKIVRDPVDALKAFIYVRVSTDRQAEEGYSIDFQIEKIKNYIATMAKPNQAVETELFIDDGYSGSSLERPQIQRMIELIKAGNGTHVVVYKLDRLSRSQKDTLYLIEDVFLTHNVEFVSVLEHFDTSSAFGRAMLGILSVFAQLERENIYERTRSGMRKRVEAGYWPGGGGTPFGYDYDPQEGILVPNNDAEKVKIMYRMYLQGYSGQYIADRLDMKYETSVTNILKRKTYAGYIVYNGAEYLGRHEPIITLETYEKTMSEFKRRSKQYNTSESKHLLTGMVYCGVCGAKMRYQIWGKRYKFVCNSQQHSKQYLIKDPNCDNFKLDTAPIEQMVLHDLFSLTEDSVTRPKETINTQDSILNVFNNDLAVTTAKLRRLYEIFSDNNDTTLLGLINELRERQKDIERKIDLEMQKGIITTDFKARLEDLKSIAPVWDSYTINEKRNTLKSFINRITITYDQVHCDYNI